MRKLKKLMAFALVLSMILQLIPVLGLTAAAATETETIFAVDNGRIDGGATAGGTTSTYNTFGLTVGYGSTNGKYWNAKSSYTVNGEAVNMLSNGAAGNPATAYNSFVKVRIPRQSDLTNVTSVKLMLNVYIRSADSASNRLKTGSCLALYEAPELASGYTEWNAANCCANAFGIVGGTSGTEAQAKLGEEYFVAVSEPITHAEGSTIEFDITDFVKDKLDEAAEETEISFRITTPSGVMRIYSLEFADSQGKSQYKPRIEITTEIIAPKAIFKENADTVCELETSAGKEYGAGEEIFLQNAEGEYAYYTVDNDVTVAGNTIVNVTKNSAKIAPVHDGRINHLNEFGTDQILSGATNETCAPTRDEDGNTVSNGGTSTNARVGLIEFNVDESLRNKAVYLHTFVWCYYPWAQSTGTATLAAYTTNNNVSVTYENMNGVTPTSIAATSDPIFALNSFSSTTAGQDSTIDTWVSFDVSEAVQKALDNGQGNIIFKILPPYGFVRMASMAQAVPSGAYPNKAAYLSTADANILTVKGADKVTKKGTRVTGTVIVPEDATVRIYSSAVNTFTDASTSYPVTGGRTNAISITEDTTISPVIKSITRGLGWNGSNFTINFNTGRSSDETDSELGGVEIEVQGENGYTSLAAQPEITADKPNVALSTNATNVIFKATPWVNPNGIEKILGTPVYASLYGVLTELIGNTEVTNIYAMRDANKAAKVNKILSDGGIYVVKNGDNYTLTPETARILGLTKVDESTLKLTVTDKAAALGVVLTSMDTNEAALGITFDISETASLQDGSVFLLEAVEIEFVPDEVLESSVADDVMLDLDFTWVM